MGADGRITPVAMNDSRPEGRPAADLFVRSVARNVTRRIQLSGIISKMHLWERNFTKEIVAFSALSSDIPIVRILIIWEMIAAISVSRQGGHLCRNS
jgi:hypothetical protein